MNLLLQLVLIILVVVLIAFIVLAILWVMRQRHKPKPDPDQRPAEKHDDCCTADADGHCGTIRLPNGFAPIGDDDPPNRWAPVPPAVGGQNHNSGIRVQVIAAGFFDPLVLPRELIEPVVTIHNQGSNLMYVGQYTQFPSHESFHTHLRVPPGASVTVTWWQLWTLWIGAQTFPLPSGPGTFFQLAVTGKDATGCYVVSWCCPKPTCCKDRIDPFPDHETGTDIGTETETKTG